MEMTWLTPSGAAHWQGPGQGCSTCPERHLLARAAADRICCGPAHEWPKVGACVFCGERWKVPVAQPGSGVYSYTERFVIPVPDPVQLSVPR